MTAIWNTIKQFTDKQNIPSNPIQLFWHPQTIYTSILAIITEIKSVKLGF